MLAEINQTDSETPQAGMEEMLNILIVIDTNVGGKGGAETHLLNFLKNIDFAQYKVDVIYFDADKSDKVQNHSDLNQVSFHRIPLRSLSSFDGLKKLLTIYKVMKSGNYDCVMSFFESSDIVTSILSNILGIKLRISNRRDTGFRHSKKLEFAYRYFINKGFNYFIAVSEAVKESLTQQGIKKEKILVLNNAVDIDRFRDLEHHRLRHELAIAEDALVLGMVANLNPVKNHSAVIEALALCHENDQKYHLVLAGDGSLRNTLKNQVASTGLTDYVHFLGSRIDVENILESMDVFILASFTEGLSNALLEAMACGKAVIATDVGGNPDVVSHGVDGLLVSTEINSIYQGITVLAESKEKRQQFSESAQRKIRDKFSLQMMMSKYYSAFNMMNSTPTTDVTLHEVKKL